MVSSIVPPRVPFSIIYVGLETGKIKAGDLSACKAARDSMMDYY